MTPQQSGSALLLKCPDQGAHVIRLLPETNSASLPLKIGIQGSKRKRESVHPGLTLYITSMIVMGLPLYQTQIKKKQTSLQVVAYNYTSSGDKS